MTVCMGKRSLSFTRLLLSLVDVALSYESLRLFIIYSLPIEFPLTLT